jgi:hypothetical protein
MDSEQNIHIKQLKEDTFKNFEHNFNIVKKKGHFITYPEKHFRFCGIPAPRQYIAWRKAINLIGGEQFKELKEKNMEFVSLNDETVLLVDKYSHLVKNEKDLSITIVCGYFWENAKSCREKMINFLAENIRNNNLKLKIITQSTTLKKEFKSVHEDIYHKIKFRKVLYRIDLHHTIIKNKNNPEKSYCFMELPHTESFIFRLNIHFSYKDAKDEFKFKCGFNKILSFLFWQRMPIPHLIIRSLPSIFNKAIN